LSTKVTGGPWKYPERGESRNIGLDTHLFAKYPDQETVKGPF